MARRFGLKNVGETLLSSKLQILNGSGNRRPSVALSILTGRVASQVERSRPQYTARTVYLTETHVRDIDFIVEAFTRSNQQPESKRVTRSAVVRRALEQLRAALEADAAESFQPLEND